MKAYGGGNDHNIETVKAGPGTVYLLEGKAPRLKHTLKIQGDVDSSVQNQAYAYIDGTTNEYHYHILTLTGWFCIMSNILSFPAKYQLIYLESGFYKKHRLYNSFI